MMHYDNVSRQSRSYYVSNGKFSGQTFNLAATYLNIILPVFGDNWKTNGEHNKNLDIYPIFTNFKFFFLLIYLLKNFFILQDHAKNLHLIFIYYR